MQGLAITRVVISKDNALPMMNMHCKTIPEGAWAAEAEEYKGGKMNITHF